MGTSGNSFDMIRKIAFNRNMVLYRRDKRNKVRDIYIGATGDNPNEDMCRVDCETLEGIKSNIREEATHSKYRNRMVLATILILSLGIVIASIYLYLF